MPISAARYSYPQSPVVNVYNVNDAIIGFEFQGGTVVSVTKSQVATVTPVQSGVGVASPYVVVQIYNNTPINVSVNSTEPNTGLSTASDLADYIVGILATGAVSGSADANYDLAVTTGTLGATVNSYAASVIMVNNVVVINTLVVYTIDVGTTEVNFDYVPYTLPGLSSSYLKFFFNFSCNDPLVTDIKLSDYGGGYWKVDCTNGAITSAVITITGQISYLLD